MRATVIVIALLSFACARPVAPRRHPRSKLRHAATETPGVFYGRVRAFDATQPCWNAPQTLGGIRVEVGLWDGSPSFYRDTITREVPTELDEPRFEVIATTITDAKGRFTFLDMPRHVPYAVRAIPPRDSPWKVAYGESMYGPPRGKDLPDFPTLCLKAR